MRGRISTEEAPIPVQDYGVVIGEFDHFDRDDANHYGNYYHGHIFVRTAGSVLYNCAVDVKYPNGVVEYFIPAKLDDTKFATVQTMSDGFHSLVSNFSSGAIDYVRDPLIREPLGCTAALYAILHWFTGKNYQVWQDNVGMSALTDLGAFLSAAGGPQRVFIFGGRYQNPNQNPPQGMHDCHLNQGDPPGQYQVLDGIWQDGGIIVERPSGLLTGFFIKFVTQTLNTDSQGLPA